MNQRLLHDDALDASLRIPESLQVRFASMDYRFKQLVENGLDIANNPDHALLGLIAVSQLCNNGRKASDKDREALKDLAAKFRLKQRLVEHCIRLGCFAFHITDSAGNPTLSIYSQIGGASVHRPKSCATQDLDPLKPGPFGEGFIFDKVPVTFPHDKNWGLQGIHVAKSFLVAKELAKEGVLMTDHRNPGKVKPVSAELFDQWSRSTRLNQDILDACEQEKVHHPGASLAAE